MCPVSCLVVTIIFSFLLLLFLIGFLFFLLDNHIGCLGGVWINRRATAIGAGAEDGLALGSKRFEGTGSEDREIGGGVGAAV